MASPIKVTIIPDSVLNSLKDAPRILPDYPDTGETGETYDLEIKQQLREASGREAVEKAREFLRHHQTRKCEQESHLQSSAHKRKRVLTSDPINEPARCPFSRE